MRVVEYLFDFIFHRNNLLNYVRRKQERCSKEADILSSKNNLQAVNTFDNNLLYDNTLS